MYDAIIIGAGAIGLSIGWKASQLGLSVLVVERADSPGGAASGVAAGMLAPVTEVHYGEDKLLNLNLASARRYPSFVDELTNASGITVQLGPPSTLFVALNRDQHEALLRLHDYQASLGLNAKLLNSQETRSLEPALHPSTLGGIVADEESAVDPLLLTRALVPAFRNAAGELRCNARVQSLVIKDSVCRGVIVDEEEIAAGQVVLCAGAFSGGIAEVPSEVAENLRPVKGQVVRLGHRAKEPPLLEHVIRTEDVYLVPRGNGEIVVGATVEEQGFDTSVTAGGILDLLIAAEEAAPGVRELALVRAEAGLRPGTPDNAPLLGKTSIEGLIVATGHYRNGILLTPVTADAVATILAKGEEPAEIQPFSPSRFEGNRK
jgi:glycine oxidase